MLMCYIREYFIPKSYYLKTNIVHIIILISGSKLIHTGDPKSSDSQVAGSWEHSIDEGGNNTMNVSFDAG